jgi:Family of unknown function (DUF6624)
MTQDIIANFFTFSDANGTLQITYYPLARLEYQGPEGHFVYPGDSPDRDMSILGESFLGQQASVVLVPSVKAIADEIIKMSEVDQQMRKSEQWDASIDVENTQRMKEIVEQMGWPTRAKVGGHASEMAWLLVQHADHDRSFQRKCLDLMKAQAAGEVLPGNIAYLEDRVRVGEGRPQVYGSQFYVDEAGNFGPRPIEDPDHVDERRQAVLLFS